MAGQEDSLTVICCKGWFPDSPQASSCQAQSPAASWLCTQTHRHSTPAAQQCSNRPQGRNNRKALPTRLQYNLYTLHFKEAQVPLSRPASPANASTHRHTRHQGPPGMRVVSCCCVSVSPAYCGGIMGIMPAGAIWAIMAPDAIIICSTDTHQHRRASRVGCVCVSERERDGGRVCYCK